MNRIAFKGANGIITGDVRKQFHKAFDLVLDQERVFAAVVEIGTEFVSEETMRDLNARYRGNDAPTDVLSFPMYENADEIRAAGASENSAGNGEPTPPVMLGDVVICDEIAKRQAADYGHSFERELLYLFVHSLFHLLGYDHEAGGEQGRAMRNAEEDILRQLDLARD